MADYQITTTVKIGAMITKARTLLAALTQLLTSPFNRGPRPNTFFKFVMYAALRKQLSVLTLAQTKYLEPTTESIYLDLAKEKGFQPDSIVLSDGCKAHWLGSKKADKVLIYFHGGGYVLSCSPGHFKWAFDVTQSLAQEHSVSCVLLGYTTAIQPGGQYPTQLKQAAELVQYMIEKEGKKPSDIILGGDSAGANLTLAVLSHILHPHPQVPTKLNISEPFRAVLLISPWTKFDRTPSCDTNAQTDMIPESIGAKWGGAFLGGAPHDEYNQPITAGEEWFKDLESVAKEILIWGGGGEILIDSINAFAKKLKAVHSKVDYTVQPGAGHEDFIIEKLLGYEHKAQGTKLIEEWLAVRLA